MKRKGFTLIELIVVVGVIVLLLSIMLPSFMSLEERAKRSGCQNNYHQIGVALAQYQGSNQLFMCWPNWLAPETNGTWPGPGWLYWYARLYAYPNYQPQDRQLGALWPYMQSHDLYHCPMDLPPYQNGPSHNITSYLMNGATCGFGIPRPFKVYDFNMVDIIFWEADEGAGWNDGSSFPSEGLTQRHASGADFGCTDGHAEWLSRDQFNLEAFPADNGRTRLWCNPASPTGH